MAGQTVTNRGAARIAGGDVALDTGDIRMAIITGNITGIHSADLNTLADIDALNAGATNIHTERIALASKTVTEDDTNDWALADCADVAFAAAPGVTALAAVVYDEGGGTDATRHVISIHTTNFPQPMDGGLNVQTPNGWLQLVPQVNF